MVDFNKIREDNKKKIEDARVLKERKEEGKAKLPPGLRPKTPIELLIELKNDCDLNPWEQSFIPSVLNWLRGNQRNTMSPKQKAKFYEMCNEYELELFTTVPMAEVVYGEASDTTSAVPTKDNRNPYPNTPHQTNTQQAYRPGPQGFDDIDDDIHF